MKSPFQGQFEMGRATELDFWRQGAEKADDLFGRFVTGGDVRNLV
jgi:hypothetical protein